MYQWKEMVPVVDHIVERIREMMPMETKFTRSLRLNLVAIGASRKLWFFRTSVAKEMTVQSKLFLHGSGDWNLLCKEGRISKIK